MERECPVCNQIIKGRGLYALNTYYELHMKTHKLLMIHPKRKASEMPSKEKEK